MTTPPEPFFKISPERLAAGGLTLLAFLLIFATASHQSLWLDEVATVSFSDPKTGWSYSEAQMPLYYILTYLSRVVLGSRDFAYRLPFLLSSFAFILLIPRVLIRDGVDRLTAQVAPLLLLLSPAFLYFSQEVRVHFPMVIAVFVWGAYRDIKGWKSWLLCTLALQTHTFAVIYVGTVVAFDWLLYLYDRRRTETAIRPSRAQALALMTHSVSILFALTHTQGGSRLAGMSASVARSPVAVLAEWFDYLVSTFHYYTIDRSVLWLLIAGLGIFNLLRRRTPTSTLFLGLGLGVVVHAGLLAFSGWSLFHRYLLVMLPLLTLPVFLHGIKSKAVSLGIAMALPLLAFAHLHVDRSIKPWPGILPQLLPMQAAILSEPQRDSWEDLVRVLESLAKPHQTYSFVECRGCEHWPVDFYGSGNPVVQSLQFAHTDPCADWVMSRAVLQSNSQCPRVLVADFGTFQLWGPEATYLVRHINFTSARGVVPEFGFRSD